MIARLFLLLSIIFLGTIAEKKSNSNLKKAAKPRDTELGCPRNQIPVALKYKRNTVKLICKYSKCMDNATMTCRRSKKCNDRREILRSWDLERKLPCECCRSKSLIIFMVRYEALSPGKKVKFVNNRHLSSGAEFNQHLINLELKEEEKMLIAEIGNTACYIEGGVAGQKRPKPGRRNQFKSSSIDEDKLEPSDTEENKLKPSDTEENMKPSDTEASKLEPSDTEENIKPSDTEEDKLKPSDTEGNMKPSDTEENKLMPSDTDGNKLKPSDTEENMKPSDTEENKLMPSDTNGNNLEPSDTEENMKPSDTEENKLMPSDTNGNFSGV